MTPQLKSLAEKMAEEYANNIQFGYGHGIADRAYLAGFEARDGMANDEHAEMLDALRWIRNNAGEDRIMNICDSLITKIESN